MFELDPEESPEPAARIARLEARVAALESALAVLSAQVGTVALGFADTQRLPVMSAANAEADADAGAAAAAKWSDPDRFSLTGAFATLDSKVAEAAAAESSIGRKSVFDTASVEIDATLIDRAHARPPPVKLHVRADIEDLHPKITKRVVDTWRTGELRQYLSKLIVDERGDRAGFSMNVMSELLLLSSILEEPEDTDKWDANARTI